MHPGAYATAIEAQRDLREHDWPDQVSLRVRMGLHTGEPERQEDDYIGIDVHRAARIAGTEHGGQIVLSATTQELVGAQGAGYRVRDLGWHRLKDISEPEHLFEVEARGLEAEHPPLRSLGTEACQPTYATELIGRSREVAEICDLFDGEGGRLVTLTGTGGSAKTRLAVAGELEHRVARDTYVVGLPAAYDRATLMWSTNPEVWWPCGSRFSPGHFKAQRS